MNIQDFSVEFEGHNLQGDLLGKSHRETTLLFLHGAGDGNKKRYFRIRERLWLDYNISSYAIDFIGHGETGGDLVGSSLEQRTNQVLKVVKEQIGTQKLILAAASMSGYTAIRLTQHLDITGMALLVPGVYWDKVYSTPFGEKFSEMIRQKNSWENSDAFELIQSYQGNILILTSEKDHVIPKELINMLIQNATSTRHKEHIEIAGAPHKLVKYLSENLEELSMITQKVADFYEQSVNDI